VLPELQEEIARLKNKIKKLQNDNDGKRNSDPIRPPDRECDSSEF
jgi:hypothetical protein